MTTVQKSSLGFAVLLLGLCLSVAAAAARHTVSAGSVEQEKSLLTAGADGAVLKFSSGLVLRLHAHTRVQQHKDGKLWLDSGGRIPAHVFTLLEGGAEVDVPPREGRGRHAALVRAGRKLSGATAGGRMTALAGTDFGVVVAYAGQVVAGDGGSWLAVKPGSAVRVMSGQNKMTPHLLPSAPKFLSTRRVWLALKGVVPIGDFAWEADGAARYNVELTPKGDANSFRAVVSKNETGPVLTQVPAGRYAVSVQSLDRYGLAGPAATLDINVVGVQDHNGSRVDAEGVIHVGINQQARFTHVEGLLMTYGTAQRWSAATETVPLWRNERTVVHFRHPDGIDMVSARLEPRGVSADVYIGPKTAVWPGDPVRISVKINDIAGAAPQDLDVKLHVTLGVQPVPVSWAQRGNSYTASVPPQAGEGPWVLRVSVVDGFGIELGRDFVEISGSPLENKKKGKARAKPQSQARAGVELARAAASPRE